MNYDKRKQYKKGKTANYLFSSSVINSTIPFNHLLNQTGTPRNDRSIICKRPSQLYQNQTQLINPRVNLRCIKSNEKPLYSSLSIHNNNNSNKEILCFEDDVQQLNIASEESAQFSSLEPVTLDSNKAENLNSVCSNATMVSPIQIKKILIENYRNEKVRESGIDNVEDNNTLSNQGGHQHSFSVVSKSPQNIDDDQKASINYVNSINNNTNNSINANSNIKVFSPTKKQQEYQINHSNFFFNIPSINIIYKSEDDKQRAKSFAPNQRNYSNFEKIKKATNNKHHHSKGNSSKEVSYQKRIKSFVERTSTHEMHNQWETLSSRIKCNHSFKPKDISCYSTGIKQSVKSNYPIVSEINKKLFNDMNTTYKKKYSNNRQSKDNSNSNYTQKLNPHQKQLKSIEPIKRKEYLNIVENLDDNNFSKLIQIIDKISVDPLSKTMKEKPTVINKEINNNTNNCSNHSSIIKKLSLTTIAKNTTAAAVKKHPNPKEIKVNYIKTDLFHSNQCNNYSSKSSFTKSKQPNYSVLSLHILSNWGNKTKVGVTEIQLFNSKGKKIPVSECHVFNGTEDNINRIINKKTHTINDNDMWSTPLVPNVKIEVYFDSSAYDVSSITIWNYNGKDLQRGIKEIELSRKNIICWRGIVPKGCFNIKTDYSLKIKLALPSSNSTNTTLSDNKCLYQSISNAPFDSADIINDINDNDNAYDTHTPSKTLTQQMNSSNIDIAGNGSSLSARNNNYYLYNVTEDDTKLLSPSFRLSFKEFGSRQFITFSKIRIQFKESYGNKNYIGLTGLKFVDKDGNIYSVETAISVGALPKDVSSEYNIDDPQIFENVFNNINETNDNSNMWLTVFNNPYIEICYEKQQTLSQLLIWNYNDPEGLDRCTKVIEIVFDDNFFSSFEILLMKGIGIGKGDYSQTIHFPFTNASYENMIDSFDDSFLFNDDDYVYPLLPSGFWFKFKLLSNYGDATIIGLNAIEFFDSEGHLIIPLRIINDPEMKLVKGGYTDLSHYWMTSYSNLNKTDNLFDESAFIVIFEKIVIVSYIKIYNIVREPKQGVKRYQIFCDDNIIFEGELKKAQEKCSNENFVVFVNTEKNKKYFEDNRIGGSPSIKDKSNKNNYQTRKTKNGFAMTLKGYNQMRALQFGICCN